MNPVHQWILVFSLRKKVYSGKNIGLFLKSLQKAKRPKAQTLKTISNSFKIFNNLLLIFYPEKDKYDSTYKKKRSFLTFL